MTVFRRVSLAPLLDQRADLRLICRVLWFVRHVFPLRKGSAVQPIIKKTKPSNEGRANGGTSRLVRAFAVFASDALATDFP
ncbi:MAG TPA: hypothetical protein VGH62_01835 [Bradyrhizobium sp.]|jgi:hypothetical protein